MFFSLFLLHCYRPTNPLLKNFWNKLTNEYAAATTEKEKKGVKRSLHKAKCFIFEYKQSLVKHNKHFTSSELLFLACFGEHETSTLVAQLFQERTMVPPEGMFPSTFHDRTIDLPEFYQFLLNECRENVPDAKKSKNYDLMKDAIAAVAERNIWDGSSEKEQYRTLFLEHYGALPSTSVWVERSVKKAKLCQRTGKGERNVTVYCIAGDILTEMCTEKIAPSKYSEKMAKRREKQYQKAISEGKKPRSKQTYVPDLERGPELTLNIVNHAQKLQKEIEIMRDVLGKEEYKNRLDQTETMLTSICLQGTFTRYIERVKDVEASRGNEYQPNARELERGVTVAAGVDGEVLWKTLLMDNNLEAVRTECRHRHISVVGKGWTQMKKEIQAQEKAYWVTCHPDTTVPKEMEKPNHFRNLSGTNFLLKNQV